MISRHILEDRQQASLRKLKGITKFVQVDGVFTTGRDAWEKTLIRCGTHPTLIVAILPDIQMMQLQSNARGIEIWEADMMRDGEEWLWSGTWTKLHAFRKVRVPVMESINE